MIAMIEQVRRCLCCRVLLAVVTGPNVRDSDADGSTGLCIPCPSNILISYFND